MFDRVCSTGCVRHCPSRRTEVSGARKKGDVVCWVAGSGKKQSLYSRKIQQGTTRQYHVTLKLETRCSLGGWSRSFFDLVVHVRWCGLKGSINEEDTVTTDGREGLGVPVFVTITSRVCYF